MTYLDYIVQFQRLRREQPFPSTSADLYYHLLWVANGLGWKNPFNEGSNILMASLGMTDKTLTVARDKLIEAGLLRYVPGKKGTFSTYELLSLAQNNTEIFRSIWGESGGETGGNQGEKPGAMRGESGGLHKIKNKSKNRESIDSTKASKKAASPKAQPTPPTELWAVWVAANAPTVQQLKKPLTGEQYAGLVNDFGELTVQQVLHSMENHAGLTKKYTSANLTARDWCKRRGAQRPGPPPPAGTSPSQATATVAIMPELNPAVVAERQAQRDAEAAANRRRFRTAHAEAPTT